LHSFLFQSFSNIPNIEYEKIVFICVLGMVGGDRNLFVRKGDASQKKIGKHWIRRTKRFSGIERGDELSKLTN